MGEGIEKGIKEITGCMEVYYKIITKRNNIKKKFKFLKYKKKKDGADKIVAPAQTMICWLSKQRMWHQRAVG